MKLEITYKLGKMHFEATTESISEAYEYIKAIIDNGTYVRPSDLLDNYMCSLAEMYEGHTIEFKDSIISVRRLKEKPNDENN